MSFLFVTGTDTGVGKTLVSRALLAAWRLRGLPVAAFKPLETGLLDSQISEQSDAAQLAKASGQTARECSFLRFEPPVAPQAAAQKNGAQIDPQIVVAECHARAGKNHLLVEGAGGLLVPIAANFLMADLAQSLDAAVLIVARARLGTINHCLLTIAECRRRGLPIAGVVLNRSDDEIGPDDTGNAALIKEHGMVSVFGPLPHLANAESATLADAAERYLPVPEIFTACYPPRP